MRTLVNCQRQMNMLSRLAIMLLRKILLPGGAFALTAVVVRPVCRSLCETPSMIGHVISRM